MTKYYSDTFVNLPVHIVSFTSSLSFNPFYVIIIFFSTGAALALKFILFLLSFSCHLMSQSLLPYTCRREIIPLKESAKISHLYIGDHHNFAIINI